MKTSVPLGFSMYFSTHKMLWYTTINPQMVQTDPERIVFETFLCRNRHFDLTFTKKERRLNKVHNNLWKTVIEGFLKMQIKWAIVRGGVRTF